MKDKKGQIGGGEGSTFNWVQIVTILGFVIFLVVMIIIYKKWNDSDQVKSAGNLGTGMIRIVLLVPIKKIFSLSKHIK